MYAYLGTYGMTFENYDLKHIKIFTRGDFKYMCSLSLFQMYIFENVTLVSLEPDFNFLFHKVYVCRLFKCPFLISVSLYVRLVLMHFF